MSSLENPNPIVEGSAAADPANSPGTPLHSQPVLWPPETKSYLEDFVQTLMPTRAAVDAQITALATTIAAEIAAPVGSYLVVFNDLTANTSEYVYTHPSTGLTYLYANGAAVSKTTYADLYALWGASKWAADVGATFILPDARGRSLWLAGTNAATDVGDNDGVAEASRQPKHTHSNSLSLTGGRTFVTGINSGANMQSGSSLSLETAVTASENQSITGSVGSGMSGSDAVAHLVIGSLVIRF